MKGVSPKPFPARLIPFRTKGETPSRAAICREFINGADKVPGVVSDGAECMEDFGNLRVSEQRGLPRSADRGVTHGLLSAWDQHSAGDRPEPLGRFTVAGIFGGLDAGVLPSGKRNRGDLFRNVAN